MTKLKSILFKVLNKIYILLSRLGVNRNTPGAFKLYNFLFRSFWPYQNIIEVQGSKMYINIKDLNMQQTFQGYASHRIHEKSTTDLFKKTVKKGNTVVDLGANIGYFSLLAARLVGENGKVYSFEPEPRNFSYLKKNIEINNYNNVTANQKAVSDRKGTTKLFICPYDTGHHTINRYDGIEAYKRGRVINKKECIEIETVTLDDFFKGRENEIDVIKMDVEGAVALALAGMDNILKTNNKLKMFVEFFPLLIEKMGSSPREFIRKLLEDYQFSIFIIPDDYDAQKGEMVKINTVEEIINFCKRKEDHINLFLEHK